MVFAHPAIVLAESDIENPMQTVLDTPVGTCSLGKGFGARDALAADVIGPLGGHGAVDFPLPLDQTDPGELGPVFAEFLVQPGQVADPHRLARFDPAMIFLDALIVADRQGAKTAGLAVGEEFPKSVRQLFLVILDSQQVVAAPVENLPGNLGLTTDGVDRDDAGGGL